jgi:hypothetical protein
VIAIVATTTSTVTTWSTTTSTVVTSTSASGLAIFYGALEPPGSTIGPDLAWEPVAPGRQRGAWRLLACSWRLAMWHRPVTGGDCRELAYPANLVGRLRVDGERRGQDR